MLLKRAPAAPVPGRDPAPPSPAHAAPTPPCAPPRGRPAPPSRGRYHTQCAPDRPHSPPHPPSSSFALAALARHLPPSCAARPRPSPSAALAPAPHRYVAPTHTISTSPHSCSTVASRLSAAVMHPIGAVSRPRHASQRLLHSTARGPRSPLSAALPRRPRMPSRRCHGCCRHTPSRVPCCHCDIVAHPYAIVTRSRAAVSHLHAHQRRHLVGRDTAPPCSSLRTPSRRPLNPVAPLLYLLVRRRVLVPPLRVVVIHTSLIHALDPRD
ncbi:hypothetical protein DENSPDRAFT_886299 [Dentipellis sp. KUC8613]|nr:hypothetical protein DENSPDRAFT_886299 [Dentipellis sp. KUC8613]